MLASPDQAAAIIYCMRLGFSFPDELVLGFALWYCQLWPILLPDQEFSHVAAFPYHILIHTEALLLWLRAASASRDLLLARWEYEPIPLHFYWILRDLDEHASWLVIHQDLEVGYMRYLWFVYSGAKLRLGSYTQAIHSITWYLQLFRHSKFRACRKTKQNKCSFKCVVKFAWPCISVGWFGTTFESDKLRYNIWRIKSHYTNRNIMIFPTLDSTAATEDQAFEYKYTGYEPTLGAQAASDFRAWQYPSPPTIFLLIQQLFLYYSTPSSCLPALLRRQLFEWAFSTPYVCTFLTGTVLVHTHLRVAVLQFALLICQLLWSSSLVLNLTWQHIHDFEGDLADARASASFCAWARYSFVYGFFLAMSIVLLLVGNLLQFFEREYVLYC